MKGGNPRQRGRRLIDLTRVEPIFDCFGKAAFMLVESMREFVRLNHVAT